jgi:hypothetical protein
LWLTNTSTGSIDLEVVQKRSLKPGVAEFEAQRRTLGVARRDNRNLLRLSDAEVATILQNSAFTRAIADLQSALIEQHSGAATIHDEVEFCASHRNRSSRSLDGISGFGLLPVMKRNVPPRAFTVSFSAVLLLARR